MQAPVQGRGPAPRSIPEGPAVDAAPAWLVPYAQCLARLHERRAHGASAAQALQAEQGLHSVPDAQHGRRRCGMGPPAASLPSFIDADAAPQGEAYEAFIHRCAKVPTRDNLHDLFNGLVWLHLPVVKRRLNGLQAAEIGRAGIGGRRGALRDALTLFDENGAVLHAPPVLWQALMARDWHTLFVRERAAWRDARLLIVGHALLEKLESPRKPLTAHVLRAAGDDPSIEGADEAIARVLDPPHLATKPFVPLPVLGVPGWWPANEDAGFYDDAAVFRPRRPEGETGG